MHTLLKASKEDPRVGDEVIDRFDFSLCVTKEVGEGSNFCRVRECKWGECICKSSLTLQKRTELTLLIFFFYHHHTSPRSVTIMDHDLTVGATQPRARPPDVLHCDSGHHDIEKWSLKFSFVFFFLPAFWSGSVGPVKESMNVSYWREKKNLIDENRIVYFRSSERR